MRIPGEVEHWITEACVIHELSAHEGDSETVVTGRAALKVTPDFPTT
jgi:hypothetical protein